MVVGFNNETGCAKARDHCTANFREKDDGLLTLLANLPIFPYTVEMFKF